MIALEETHLAQEHHHPESLYSCLPARAHVVYRPEPDGFWDAEYLLDVAENAGLGGLFLATTQTLPPGTVLALEIESAEEHAPSLLRGRAVVRWRRRWGRLRGMQVELFELEEVHPSGTALIAAGSAISDPPMLS
jgi:hypothetical protein